MRTRPRPALLPALFLLALSVAVVLAAGWAAGAVLAALGLVLLSVRPGQERARRRVSPGGGEGGWAFSDFGGGGGDACSSGGESSGGDGGGGGGGE